MLGFVGAVDAVLGGKSVIWLSASAEGELIAKLLIDVPAKSWLAPPIGGRITVACRAVYRSYALVLGLCEAP